MDATISVYLDTRREKLDKRKKDKATKPPEQKGKKIYPVKLRVYFNYETRFYPTGIDLSVDDFKRSYLAQKPRQQYKPLKEKIAAIEARANNLKQSLRTFSFTQFEKILFRPTGSSTDVLYCYNQIIDKITKEGRINTATSYDCSLKSLTKYIGTKGEKKLSLDSITKEFLEGYEKWMTTVGNNKTTVGIYLRPLRAIFNTAIVEGDIEKELYPFGKNKYQIPAGRNIKKSIQRNDLKKLFEFKTDSDQINKARAFWFFSYSTNGINIKDIAELKYKNISGKTISFIRSKTKNSTKGKSIPIVASLTPFAKLVIDKYGNRDRSLDNYIFPILNYSMDETQKVRAVQTFTRFINQHIKRLAKLTGVNGEISTYYARHSFTTMAVQNGASLEYIQDSLGHASINTTMNYWAGFGESMKKKISDKIMNFQ